MDGGCCYWPCHVKVCACATLAGQWWSWTREDAKVRRTRKYGAKKSKKTWVWKSCRRILVYAEETRCQRKHLSKKPHVEETSCWRNGLSKKTLDKETPCRRDLLWRSCQRKPCQTNSLSKKGCSPRKKSKKCVCRRLETHEEKQTLVEHKITRILRSKLDRLGSLNKRD